MPTADITYHSTAGDKTPVFKGHAIAPMPVLGPQIGNSAQLDFTSGAVSGQTRSADCVVTILADAMCRIAIGEDIAATIANSRKIPANLPFEFYCRAGERVSIIGA